MVPMWTTAALLSYAPTLLSPARAPQCGVAEYGCYDCSSLPSGCPDCGGAVEASA